MMSGQIATMAGMRVVVTGCASGIGAEAARLLKLKGAEVTGIDIVEPGAHVDHFLAVDLADVASIDRAAGALHGRYDALCNIAGLPCRPDLRAKLLAVNVRGLRRLTRALIPMLGDGASIVNLASRAGQRWRDNMEQVKALLRLPDDADLAAFCEAHGVDDVRAYDLSKEALIVWTMAQTEPWGARGLRINTISPAAVDTTILADFINAFGDRATRQIARAGRAASPTEVAEVVAFLASRDSRWMKGVDIIVDGGQSAFVTSDLLGLAELSGNEASSWN